jgi:hypothetical protein
MSKITEIFSSIHIMFDELGKLNENFPQFFENVITVVDHISDLYNEVIEIMLDLYNLGMSNSN